MKKIVFTVIIISILLFSILLSYSDPFCHKDVPAASKGTIDLTAWDFNKNGLISLDGEWACYDGQLLTPQDFKKEDGQAPRLTAYVELTKGRIGNAGLKSMEAKGIRTYRLIIKTSTNQNTYGLTIDNINMRNRVYVNGVLQGESGNPALKDKGYQQKTQAYSIFFQPHSSFTEIILQTANFEYPFHGTQYDANFGLQNQIIAAAEITCAIELCGMVISFLISFFYLCLYLALEKDRRYLFSFGEFLGLSLVFLTFRYKLIYFLFPNIPFEVFAKLHTICIPIVLISIVAYSRSINGTFLSTWYIYIVNTTGFIYFIIVLLTPYSVYVYFSGAADIFVISAMVCYLLMQLRLYHAVTTPARKVEILLGSLCIITLTIYFGCNFLYDFSWIHSKVIGSLAACVFYLLSMSTMALRLVVSMNQTVRNELAFLQTQIRPHFIYNTINTIISFCYTDSERAADLLENFSKYLRLTFDVDNQVQTIPLQREINMVKAYTKIEQARFGNKIRIEYDIDQDLLDREIPPLIIQPLVENSIRHGLRNKEAGGFILVSVKNLSNVFTITVRDTGIGMNTEHLNHLNKWQRVNKGVGIANLRRRIRHWENARIDFASVENVGTIAMITVKPQKKKLKKGVIFFENHRHRR